MSSPLEGVKVVEVTGYVMGSTTGAILADLGAEVVKVEPRTGDPMRGLANALSQVTDADGVPSSTNPIIEFANRGKRSMCLDLSEDAGREVLFRLASAADVFLTNYLEGVRGRLGIDVADIRRVNPEIIYARASGWGAKGPMRDRASFDIISAWAGSGLAHLLIGPEGEPPPFPVAIFDVTSANALAGAIGVALYQRATTGETSVVDVSLFNTGLWATQANVIAAPHSGASPQIARQSPANPLANWYQTADSGWFYLSATQHERFWSEFCEVLGQPELRDDARFDTAELREQNASECADVLAGVFATRTLEEWCKQFEHFSGSWGPMNTPLGVHEHPQVEPNGYLNEHVSNSGLTLNLVAPPMQFDEESLLPQGPAPEAGQHTEEVLLELGYSWDQIGVLQAQDVIGPK